MSRRFTILGILGLAALLLGPQLRAQSGKADAPRSVLPGAAYLGQKLPGDKPERFAPALLAPFPFLGRIAFSPNGRECFFSVGDATYSTSRLFMTRFVDGAWSEPEVAPFTAGFEKAREPFLSADGNVLYFNATTKDTTTGMDIWKLERTGQGWGAPIRLPEPLNSEANDFCFSQVADGTIYFLSRRSGVPQSYLARRRPDQSLQVEPLPAPITVAGVPNGDPCVAPDGRFLVFYTGRPGDFGNGDLYVSFANGKGGWTDPVNLGPDFNTAASEYGATLSPDGNYLFFVRRSMDKGELYWVSTRAIDKLRPR